MVRARAKTSNGSTAFCRCINISPESSYADINAASSLIRDTPRQPPPSNGFMNSG